MSVSFWRRLVQLVVVFLVIYFTFFNFSSRATIDWLCPFWHSQTLAAGNINSLYLGLSWKPVVINAVWFLVGIVFFSLVLGRVFCGWICSFGFFLEIVNRFSFQRKKKYSEKIVQEDEFGKVLSKIKYLVLLMSFFFAFYFKEAYFCDFCPAGGVFKSMVGAVFPLSLAVFVFVLVGVIIFGMKFWCRFLCPLGALLSWFSFGQVFRLKRGEEKSCVSCGDCFKVCPVDIKVENEFKKDELYSADCLMCLRCVAECKNKAIRFP